MACEKRTEFANSSASEKVREREQVSRLTAHIAVQTSAREGLPLLGLFAHLGPSRERLARTQWAERAGFELEERIPSRWSISPSCPFEVEFGCEPIVTGSCIISLRISLRGRRHRRR